MLSSADNFSAFELVFVRILLFTQSTHYYRTGENILSEIKPVYKECCFKMLTAFFVLHSQHMKRKYTFQIPINVISLTMHSMRVR